MGYPETATGFAIKDQKKWTEFEKYEVKICEAGSLKLTNTQC